MKALPRKTVDARKEIVSGFVGPSYNASLTCPSNSTFVPDTPPEIPERIYPPSYSKIYDQLRLDTDWAMVAFSKQIFYPW